MFELRDYFNETVVDSVSKCCAFALCPVTTGAAVRTRLYALSDVVESLASKGPSTFQSESFISLKKLIDTQVWFSKNQEMETIPEAFLMGLIGHLLLAVSSGISRLGGKLDEVIKARVKIARADYSPDDVKIQLETIFAENVILKGDIQKIQSKLNQLQISSSREVEKLKADLILLKGQNKLLLGKNQFLSEKVKKPQESKSRDIGKPKVPAAKKMTGEPGDEWREVERLNSVLEERKEETDKLKMSLEESHRQIERLKSTLEDMEYRAIIRRDIEYNEGRVPNLCDPVALARQRIELAGLSPELRHEFSKLKTQNLELKHYLKTGTFPK